MRPSSYVIVVVSVTASLATTITLAECFLWRKMVSRTEAKCLSFSCFLCFLCCVVPLAPTPLF